MYRMKLYINFTPFMEIYPNFCYINNLCCPALIFIEVRGEPERYVRKTKVAWREAGVVFRFSLMCDQREGKGSKSYLISGASKCFQFSAVLERDGICLASAGCRRHLFSSTFNFSPVQGFHEFICFLTVE